MSDNKSKPARLRNYEFIFEKNSTQFHAYSLRHALTMVHNDFRFREHCGVINEIIIPDNIRLKYSWKTFIHDFLNHRNITEAQLIEQRQTNEPRKFIDLQYVLPSIREKAIYIRDLEGWDELLPIQFVHWFGNHYAMFIGPTNTRWFYDIEHNELD